MKALVILLFQLFDSLLIAFQAQVNWISFEELTTKTRRGEKTHSTVYNIRDMVQNPVNARRVGILKNDEISTLIKYTFFNALNVEC